MEVLSHLRKPLHLFLSILFFLITVTSFGQATLPVNATFSGATTAGPGTLQAGFTQTGLGGYSGALKFDTEGDFLRLQFGSAPGALTFDLGINNAFTATTLVPATATFTVQQSVNGSAWTDVIAYSNVACGTKTISTFNAATRYIRWYFTTKPSGFNVALKNVSLARLVVDPAIVFNNVTKTFGQGTFNMTASSNSGGAITYSIDNANIASINITSGLVTINHAGTAIVTVNQVSTSDYNSATRTATLTIEKASLVINQNNYLKNYGSVLTNGTKNSAFVYPGTNDIIPGSDFSYDVDYGIGGLATTSATLNGTTPAVYTNSIITTNFVPAANFTVFNPNDYIVSFPNRNVTIQKKNFIFGPKIFEKYYGTTETNGMVTVINRNISYDNTTLINGETLGNPTVYADFGIGGLAETSATLNGVSPAVYTNSYTFSNFTLGPTATMTLDNYNISTGIPASIKVKKVNQQIVGLPITATKAYGEVDYTLNATAEPSYPWYISSYIYTNTTPITYTSSNTDVATVINGLVHIVGPGTTTITATKPGDDNYYIASAMQTLTVTNLVRTVNLKLHIQIYYDSSANAMRSVMNNQDGISSMADVELLTVALHESDPPNAIAATTNAILHTDGTLQATFPSLPNGSYYIAVKGKNMVHTWSASPQPVSETPSTYDFTDSKEKSYGDNMVQVAPGVWAFYSGDINQDESIDNSDSDNLFSDIENSNFGILTTDLNGDGSVDNSDLDSFFNNVENSIFSAHP